MKITYSIKVLAGVEELETDAVTGMFGLAKARAIERFEALQPEGATQATVHDDVGRRVFLFPKSELPNVRLH